MFQVEFDGGECSSEHRESCVARRAGLPLDANNSSANAWSLTPGENLRQQVVARAILELPTLKRANRMPALTRVASRVIHERGDAVSGS